MDSLEGKLRLVSERAFIGKVPFLPDFHLCAASVKSVHTGLIDVAGVGRDRTAAIASALGEATETLAQDFVNEAAKVHKASERNDWSGWFVHLGDHDQDTVVFAETNDGSAEIAVPVSCVLRTSAKNTDLPPVSEGAAAGPTTAHARLFGALELVERDAVARWWRGGQPARRVSLGVMERIGVADRQVMVLDISHGSLAPVAAMVSQCKETGVFAFSAASRPSFAGAVDAATCELVQFEVGQVARMKSSAKNLRVRDASALASRTEIMPVLGPFDSDLATVPDYRYDTIPGLLAQLLQRAEAKNVEFGFIDLTREDSVLSVAKVVSPSLEPSTLRVVSKTIRSVQTTWGPPDERRSGIELYPGT